MNTNVSEPATLAQGTENLEVMAEAVNYNSWLLSMVERALGGAERVLDFGAGDGQFAIPIANSGRSVVCVEPEARSRTILTRAGIESHPDLSAIPDGSLDAAYTLNVLEHIPDDAAILRELHRRLKPGGTLFIYVPAFMCLYTAMDERVGHVRRYRKAELIQRVKDGGFRIKSAGYADSLGFFATLAYKLVGSSKGDINRTMLRLYDRIAFPVSCVLDGACGPLFGKNVWIKARHVE